MSLVFSLASVVAFCNSVILASAGAAAPVADEVVVRASPRPLITIPLDKQYVPVVRNEKVVSHKTAYFGKVFLGLPKQQQFTVVFDTGSGHLFLPSSTCETDSCKKHRRFDRSASGSVVDIDYEGTAVPADAAERDQVSISYGTGSVVGEFVRETVCLADHSGLSAEGAAGVQTCIHMRVITATELSQDPFDAFKFDGVLGLGLDSLAVDPEFSFFGQMAKANNLTDASFGYFLSRDDTMASEISFGGYDPRRMASPMQWVPVHEPKLGFWQMQVKKVSVAGEALPLCEEGDCVAIADTGTSLLGAPRQVTQRLHWLLARKVPGNPEELDCREFHGPDLIFELANGVTLTLGPEDYSRTAAMQVVQQKTGVAQTICRASLLPVDGDAALGPKTWILGEPVLRKYYTAYDWKQQQIGFALAKQSSSADESMDSTHTVFDASSADPPSPTLMHI